MTSLPYVHVDAFADRAFTGNQAAVMPLGAWLDDAVLLAIAAENNFAETAFIVPDASGQADYELRWFTPVLEVGLCGHATLAAGHVVLGGDAALQQVSFLTRRAGILTVTRDAAMGQNAYALGLPAQMTQPVAIPDWADALGLPPEAHYASTEKYHILTYPDADAVLELTPDFPALAALGDHLFICTAPGAGHASGAEVVSRVFAPGAGINEDSVTGSAHAALTPYWAGRFGRARFSAYQASQRGGHIGCHLDGDRAVLSGRCVTVVEGLFHLP